MEDYLPTEQSINVRKLFSDDRCVYEDYPFSFPGTGLKMIEDERLRLVVLEMLASNCRVWPNSTFLDAIFDSG